ncbi:MAG: response regulator [Leptospira sp.]|nr:response regulator [Leptospira sp.]
MKVFTKVNNIAFIIGIILFFVGIFHFAPEIEEKEQIPYVDLRDSLYYKLDENSEWKKFITTSHDFDSPPNRKMWMKIHLPEFKIPNNFLFIEVIEISARFYLEGELIHTHGKWDTPERPSKFTNFFSAIVHLPEKASGKVLDVELHSDWKRIGLRRQIGIGHYEEIFNRFIKIDTPNIIFSFFYIILGISCFIIYGFTKENLLFYLGATSLALGLACVAEMNFNLTPYLYYQLTPYLGWISYFLVVLFFMKYTEELYNLKNNKIFKYFHVWLFIVYIFSWIILYVYGFSYNYTAFLEIPYGITLAIGGILILVSSINFTLKGNIEARIFLIGINIFILGSMNYTFFMLDLNDDLESDTHLRFFPMILCAVWIIGLRYRNNQKLLLEYSQELESSQVLLEERIQEKTKNLEISNQKLIESNRSRTEFFANVSHEFKTPLTLILAPLDKLLKYTHDENQIFLLKTIRGNALRMEYLVEDLLAIAKIDFGYFKPRFLDVDLTTYLNQFSKDFEILCSEKGLHFEFNLPTDVIFKKIHKFEWDLILRNLLSNAVKFTREGSIYFSVSLQKEFAHIKIKDTGIGIEENELDKIFDRFYRTERSLNLSIIGSGIGLNIVKRMVNLCGGSIAVASKPNEGTEFIVTLPVLPSKMNESSFFLSLDINQYKDIPEFIQQPSAKDSTKNIDLQHDIDLPIEFDERIEKILIIEDEFDMGKFLQFILKDNYSLKLVSNAEDALEILMIERFDIILSDWNLPKMNGSELLQKVRDLNIRTPFLFLTALTDSNHQEIAFNLGADDFITKPFKPVDLLNRIKLRLEKQKDINSTINKEKDSVYSDIHDIIGGQMFDLHLLLNQIQLTDPNQVDILNKIKSMINSCTNELRNRLHQWEDLQTIQTNFELGFKSMLIRRYNNLERSCQVVHLNDLNWEEANDISAVLKTEIYRSCLEISNNDIKYGFGDTKWTIHSLLPIFHLEIETSTNYSIDSPKGRGSRDLQERAKKVKGKLDYRIEGGSFILNLHIPIKTRN